ncbi:hypothetical protein [Glaciimonas sp. PCH181]|uniref:hypothetical protein n=1 Tax=Glaciimonas sp. PCH181 TaxID=2133943 RepID=UPI001374992E|nr:hypothetical protein [Glaciimonas sp. PCH181]
MAASGNISIEAATAVFQNYEDAITNVFDRSNQPEIDWNKLTDSARRLVDVQYALEEADDNLQRNETLIFATGCYALPPNPATFLRLYIDVLQIADLASNAVMARTMRTSPSDALRILLSAESSKDADLFFNNYQKNGLQNPQAFDSAVLLHHYLIREESQSPHNNSTDIVLLRKTFKRAIGFERACQHETPAILKLLHYDGIVGPHFHTLENRKKLTEIPIFLALDETQQQALMHYVQLKIGVSTRYQSGTLAEAVDTMLTRFPRGAGLNAAGFPGSNDDLFNLLLALYLAKSNDAIKINHVTAKALWSELVAAHKKVPGLLVWLDHQLLTTSGAIGPMIVATIINSMRKIANAIPSRNITAELINYAKKMVETRITTAVYGGENWKEVVWSLDNYLTSQLENETLPASMQAWNLWLQGKHSEQILNNSFTYPAGLAHPTLNKKYSDATTLAYAAQIVGWPDGITLGLTVSDIIDNDPPMAADISSADERDIPAIYYSLAQLARSGHRNINVQKNDIVFPVKAIHNETRMTTVVRHNGQLLDDHWHAKAGFSFAQMFAENILDGRLYSSWPTADNPNPNQIMIGRRRLSEIPTIHKVTTIFSVLEDFSDRNAAEVFDNIFVINKRDIDLSSCDPRAVFIDIYTRCWLFRAIVNEGRLYVGPWKIVYGDDVYTDHDTNRMSMLRDDQLGKIPRSYDMTGNKHGHSAQRVLVHEWLHIFLQQNDPPSNNLEDQGLIVALVNCILQHVGLMSTERLSYYQPPKLLPLEKRFEQFRVMQWANQYLEAQIAELAPAAFDGAVFCQNASEHITVKNTLNYLATLPQDVLPYSFLLSKAITVAANVDSQRHLTTIYHMLYNDEALFARLVQQHILQLLSDTPWRYIYLDRMTPTEILQSHHVDHEKRTVSLYDTGKYTFYYMTANGLAPLNSKRQALYIMLEILTGATPLSAEESCLHRGEIVAMADLCLSDNLDGSVPATMGATVDALDVNRILRLAKNQMAARQYTFDENTLIQRELATVATFWRRN